MTNGDREARPSRLGVLRTIALYKLFKVGLLLLAAYFELRLHERGLSHKLLSWAAARPSGLEHELVTSGLQWFSGLSESKLHALRSVTFTYAAVFAVEGVGLWMRKRWAEWLTVIITASLIPPEIWELAHRPNIGKAAVVAVNSAIVVYLFWHVRARGRRCEVDGSPTDTPTRSL
ncbi:MAG: hypothetical protein NVSMB10_15730 [Steroidobacteraceae bacterium]|nr:DUF2127 domain-containing protein [Pseudomonadota bacterium]